MTSADLDAVLRVATEAALEAGAVIREAFDKPKNIESKKNDVRPSVLSRLRTQTSSYCVTPVIKKR